MGNNLSLAAGGGGGGSSTPSSPDDDTQSFHTAADDTTNNNNINSDQNITTTSIDASNKIIANKIIADTQHTTPSSPPKHITFQDNYSSTSSSNINDDKNRINNNYDSNLINTHNKNVSSAHMVCNNNNNNNNSHNPEATSSTLTSSASLDDSIYPVCNAQLIELNKSAALILESLDDDEFIDQLVKQGYERRVVCEVLAENGYGNEGFYGQFNIQKMQLILYQIQEHHNSMIDTNNEDAKPSGSVSTLYNSPSHGRKGSGNNNMNDGDAIGDITDGVSKLRSPSGAVHSPMKSPSKELSHNDKRIKQSTINNNDELRASDIHTQSASVAVSTNNYTNLHMEVDNVTPAINRTANIQSSLPNVFVPAESNNVGGMSADPERNTNNMHIKLEEESSNPTSGLNANGYIHPHTLHSTLWSSTADADASDTNNNNNQSQHQLNDMYDGETADIDNDVNYQIGDDSEFDHLLQLVDNLDEAEQMLGHDVNSPEELIDLLLNQNQDRDWLPEGIERPFQNTNKSWVLNRDESVQLNQDSKIGFRQPLNVAESKSFFGPYGTARRLCPLFSYQDRTRYCQPVSKGLIAKGVEDLEVIYCPCLSCPVELRLGRVNGGLVVYELEDPATGLPYKHSKTAHKNHPMDGNSTPMSLSFEQKEFVLQRMGKQSCSAICYEMLADHSITKTTEQKKNSKELTAVISTWMSNPHTKEKYMQHEWRQEDFTNSEVNDILESLMESSTSSRHTDFMDSSYYKSMKKHLNVIEHDYGEGGDKKLVVFETKDIAQRVELAGQMYDDEEGDKKNAVQINCDFAHIPGTDMVLGTCGVDDFKRKDWLTSFCVCPAEDAVMAEKVMRATVVRIDADSRARRDKALIDGAGALKKAARALLLKVRECHAHIVRMALRRGGGKRGSKGSLSRYLLTNMGLGYKDMAKV